MQPIANVVQDLIEAGMTTYEGLAQELGVSPATVGRWTKGESQPRPPLERRIREIAQLTYPTHENTVRTALDRALAKLREVLHRRGRFSSRNESLDEISKLLFAHVTLASDGKPGVTRAIVAGATAPATALKTLVDQTIRAHLPASLSHETSAEDFELKLKPQEDQLAGELVQCFEELSSAAPDLSVERLSHLDLLNDVFGKFLAGSFVDEKELGQYLTPTEVVRFMVQVALTDMRTDELAQLLDPERCTDSGVILDPSCGVGSFLAETIRVLQSRVVIEHGHAAGVEWLDKMVREAVVGIDKSERMIRLALTNLAMFGAPAVNVHLANALARTGPEGAMTGSYEGRARLILSNPPFGAEFASTDIAQYRIATAWSHRVPTKVDSELLFIERYVDWLAPNGQCVVIVPDSVLTNRGLFENLRNGLAKRIAIRSVVSLPSVTFGAAGTSTKTSVLHFRKIEGAERTERQTLVAVCQDVGYTVATRGSHRRKVGNGNGDLPKILEDMVARRERGSTTRWVTDLEQTHRWDAAYHASLPEGFRERIASADGGDLTVRGVADVASDRADPRRWGTGTFRYIEIADVDLETCMLRDKVVRCAEAPSRARKLVRAGDVLVSTVRPERKAVGVVRADQDGCVCTTGFAVLRPRGLDPLTLAHLLKTDFVTAQLLRHMAGIAYPAIEETCLPDVVLPLALPALASFRAEAEDVLRREQDVSAARQAHAGRVEATVAAWLEQAPATRGSKPPQSNQTRSHPQSRT